MDTFCNLIAKAKENYLELLKSYENPKASVKDTATAAIFLVAMLIVFMWIFTKEKGIVKIAYEYIILLFVITILIIIGSCDCWKKLDLYPILSFVRHKYTAITLFVFIVVSSPALLISNVAKYIGIVAGGYLSMTFLFKFFPSILVNAGVYMFEFVFYIIDYSLISGMSKLGYILYIAGIHVAGSIIRKIANKLMVTGNYYEQYSFKCEVEILQKQILNIISVLLGIAGLYISLDSEYAYMVYILIPIVFIQGCEQISSVSSRQTRKERYFIKDLYAEMLILKEIAIPQIQKYSLREIKPKLSVIPCVIDCQKEYLVKYMWYNQNKKDLIEKTMDDMKKFLQCKYIVCIEEERNKFLEDIELNINNLAHCLLKL